jgi:hypothetical protein
VNDRRPGRAERTDGAGPADDGPREARRVERRDVDREQGEPLAAGERRTPARSTPRRARPIGQ